MTSERPAARGIGRNTAIFSVLTGLSRVAGLAREVLASFYFGTSAAFSAFTIAFAVPNVVRAFFADAALSAAFVPVFTELLEKDRKQDAFRLAGTLLLGITLVLGAITVLFVATAGTVMPLLVDENLRDAYGALTAGLSIVMFPIVLLLALNGVLIGMLQSFDRFTIAAVSPVVWNVVIMTFLVGGQPLLEGDDELYGYAFGVLAGTFVQLVMALPQLKGLGFRFRPSRPDATVRRVLLLMLPVTLALGLINVNALINQTIGFRVGAEVPAAIDKAFRLYMLPQGLFSVAIATVLFPALSRLATRRDFRELGQLVGSGNRLILLLLVPAAALTAVLAEPLTRLVYERGAFDEQSTDLTAEALLWFSFSLPLNGLSLLLTRAFFSLQRPWATTALAVVNLIVNAAVALALYEPYGIAGIIVATGVANLVMVAGQVVLLRRGLGTGIDGARTIGAAIRIAIAAVPLAVISVVAYRILDDALGRGFGAQVVVVGVALTLGGAAYLAAVLRMDIPEVEQLRAVLRRVADRLRSLLS